MNKNILVKSKILATIGPATDTEDKLLDLIDAGANGFRLNFSHGTEKYFEKLFTTIYNVCGKRKLPIPIIQDLQGPKIRIGKLENESILLKEGKIIEITTKDILGNSEIVSCSYESLTKDAEINDIILIDDGLIELKVKEKKKDSIICEIVTGGILKPKKGMNLPGMKLSTEAVTHKDKKDMLFAFKHRVDYVALSFVRSAKDIISLREWMNNHGFNKQIIAKIEKPEAVENFEEILKVSDAIMVARGDLGVEIAPYHVPVIQKRIIRRCNEVGKLVITATQMLESMIYNPTPTRAEASDVANAVIDGTDVVMLSGETAAGKYPIQTVRIMKNIIYTTELQNQFKPKINFEVPEDKEENMFDATARGVVDVANQIKAKIIVIFTHQGRQAKIISKYNPNAHIYAFSDSFETLNDLNLHKDIKPIYMEDINNEDYYINRAKEILKEENVVTEGDVVLFSAGSPSIESGRKNWIKFYIV
ncbi:MAG: pyruvate kinase [Ignavibacteriae bacterium]|nr:MAG: pyruvate kinase [Ignavibacteriota bacterium]